MLQQWWRLHGLLVAMAIGILVQNAFGQEWTRFRGPNGSGVVEDVPGIPSEWTSEGYLWRSSLPGAGHSSPVVWGQKIFVTSADEESGRRHLVCLDLQDGQEHWRKSFAGDVYPHHQFNLLASSTPAVDEKHVYVAWVLAGRLHLYALDHQGDETWSVDLGPFITTHGLGTSPILHGDLVILNNAQSGRNGLPGKSSVVALRRENGQIAWETPRDTRETAYSSPCILQPVSGEPQLIVNSGAEGITSLDPTTGNLHWQIDVFDKRSVSSPVVVEGLVFGSCGSGGGGNYVVAVQPADLDSQTPPKVVYKVDTSAPYVPTAVARDGLIYLFYDRGIVSCVRAANGDNVWRKRTGGEFFGSPVIVGDRIFCISNQGEVFVLGTGEEFQLLGKNSLGEPSQSTPAIVGGVMLLRSLSHLSAIGSLSAASLP